MVAHNDVLSEKMYLCVCTYLNASVQENTVLRTVYYESTVTHVRLLVAI